MVARAVTKKITDLPVYTLNNNQGNLLYSEEGVAYQYPISGIVKKAFTFAVGGTLRSMADRISDGTHLYYWTGSYPVIVDAGSTVDTLGGLGIGYWSVDGDARLRNELASVGTALTSGATRVMASNGLNLQNIFDSRTTVSVLEFIPLNLWQYISQEISAIDAVAGAGDLYQYIVAADAVAYSTGKTLHFPAGQYPISQTYNQTARRVTGIFGASFLVPTADFPNGSFLHAWASRSGQPRLTTSNMSYDGLGKTVGGFIMSTGCHTSGINGLFIRNCWHSGLRIFPAGADRDIVNLHIENIYILDSGTAATYAGLSIELNSTTTNWTDGRVSGISIGVSNSDTTQTVGPRAFTIALTGKSMFNVTFDEFNTTTRLAQHVRITSNSRLLMNGCAFRNFSGETHKYINGVDTNGYYTSEPQIYLQAGYRNYFGFMYSNGSLQNGGLYIADGLEPIFEGFTFQPGQYTAYDTGSYLPALTVAGSAVFNATFINCSIRNLTSTSYGAPWKTTFTKYITDLGDNTSWESAQMTNTPVVQKGLDYYSAMTLKSGSSTLYYPTNALSYGADIVFSSGTNNSLVMGFPATSNATDDENVQYAILAAGQGVVDYYYLTARLTMTAGTVNNHYLKFQMWSTSFTISPDTLNSEVIIFCRFPVGTSTTLNRLIIHIGHSTATTSAVSFTLTDIILTTSKYAYPPRYAKQQQCL